MKALTLTHEVKMAEIKIDLAKYIEKEGWTKESMKPTGGNQVYDISFQVKIGPSMDLEFKPTEAHSRSKSLSDELSIIQSMDFDLSRKKKENQSVKFISKEDLMRNAKILEDLDKSEEEEVKIGAFSSSSPNTIKTCSSCKDQTRAMEDLKDKFEAL